VNARAHQSFTNRYVRIFLRARWLVLGIISPVVLLIELYEDHPLPFLLLEFAVYGLAIPLSLWFLLTLLAQSMARHARSEDDLNRHQYLNQQLALHQTWDELARFVMRLPAALGLPVERASLLVYDHRHARLKLVGDWNAATGATSAADFDPFYEICRACLSRRSPQLRDAFACGSALDAEAGRRGGRHCLALAYRGVMVGVLHLRCLRDETLSADHVKFMNEAAPDIALALVIAIAHTREMARLRNETLLDERRHLGYELHDSLAQQIGFLHLGLDRLATDARLREFESVQQELDRMREVAGDAYARIRDTLSIFRSQDITDLAQAIADYTQTLSRHAHVECSFTSEGEPVPLSPAVRRQAFDLVREGLTNVEKHARARQAHIALCWAADSLRVCVVDDGVGFDPQALLQGGHYGIAMMSERIADLGGELRVDSAPGRGTRLEFKIPLPGSPSRPEDRQARLN
jgi:signal transduction histidine kinase